MFQNKKNSDFEKKKLMSSLNIKNFAKIGSFFKTYGSEGNFGINQNDGCLYSSLRNIIRDGISQFCFEENKQEKH